MSSNEHRAKAARSLVYHLRTTWEVFDQANGSAGSYCMLLYTVSFNLSRLTAFSSQKVHPELAQRFTKMKTHDYEVIAAAKRQLSRPGDSEERWHCWNTSLWILTVRQHRSVG